MCRCSNISPTRLQTLNCTRDVDRRYPQQQANTLSPPLRFPSANNGGVAPAGQTPHCPTPKAACSMLPASPPTSPLAAPQSLLYMVQGSCRATPNGTGWGLDCCWAFVWCGPATVKGATAASPSAATRGTAADACCLDCNGKGRGAPAKLPDRLPAPVFPPSEVLRAACTAVAKPGTALPPPAPSRPHPAAPSWPVPSSVSNTKLPIFRPLAAAATAWCPARSSCVRGIRPLPLPAPAVPLDSMGRLWRGVASADDARTLPELPAGPRGGVIARCTALVSAVPMCMVGLTRAPALVVPSVSPGPMNPYLPPDLEVMAGAGALAGDRGSLLLEAPTLLPPRSSRPPTASTTAPPWRIVLPAVPRPGSSLQGPAMCSSCSRDNGTPARSAAMRHAQALTPSPLRLEVQ